MFHMILLIRTQEHNTIIAIVIRVQGTEYNSWDTLLQRNRLRTLIIYLKIRARL